MVQQGLSIGSAGVSKGQKDLKWYSKGEDGQAGHSLNPPFLIGGDRTFQKSQEGVGSEFCRWIGGDAKKGECIIKGGDQLFPWRRRSLF